MADTDVAHIAPERNAESDAPSTSSREKQAEWRAKNIEKCRAYTRNWNKKRYHADVEAARQKVREEYRKRKLRNPEREREKARERMKRWRALNPEKRRESFQKWKEKNPDHLRDRRQRDPVFRLTSNLRTRIGKSIRSALGGRKTRDSSSRALLGCTIPELIVHLERQFLPKMTWDNYGDWHVDHIRPCSSFDLTKIEQQRACFHFTNLRPLWSKDNRTKSGKVTLLV